MNTGLLLAATAFAAVVHYYPEPGSFPIINRELPAAKEAIAKAHEFGVEEREIHLMIMEESSAPISNALAHIKAKMWSELPASSNKILDVTFEGRSDKDGIVWLYPIGAKGLIDAEIRIEADGYKTHWYQVDDLYRAKIIALTLLKDWTPEANMMLDKNGYPTDGNATAK